MRVVAGAEDQAGIEPQRLTPVGGYLFPFRYDDQLFADLDGLIIFAPVVLPVAVLDKRCLHRAVCAAYFRKDGLAVGVVAEVALYAADARELLLQLVVHIVPVLVIIFEEILKIGLVFYNKSVRAHVRHLLAALIYKLGRCVNAYFDPTHDISPSKNVCTYCTRCAAPCP